MHYNLVQEKFVSARFQDGHLNKLSLEEVLKQAHLISRLEYEYLAKTELYAIYRFLTQLVCDIYRPKDTDTIYNIYQTGKFDPGKIDEYFRENGDRFDLFSNAHPFMQTLLSVFKNPEKAKADINEISPIIHQGNNDVFYNPVHHLKKETEWTPEHVIGNLILNNLCHVKTGGGFKAPLIGGLGNTPLFVLHEADSLFTTIILGMDPVKETDVPYWRRDKYGEVYELSLMNYEFYPVMKFFYDEADYDGKVFSNIYYESDNAHPIFKIDNFSKFTKSLQLSHPGTIKLGNEEKGYYAEMTDRAKSNWLSLGVLLKSRALDSLSDRPVTELMIKNKTMPEKIDVSYFGLYKGQKPPFRNIYETIDNIPPRFLFEKSRQTEAELAITYIENAGSRLQWVTGRYISQISGTKKSPKMYSDVSQTFYRDMKNIFLVEFARDDNADTKEFIKKTNIRCLKAFRDLPAIREDVVTKRVYERELQNMLVKEMEKIYGKEEDGSSKNIPDKKKKA